MARFARAFAMVAAITAGLFVATIGCGPATAQPIGASEAAELAVWDSVRNSTNPAEVRAYLERFPNGTFAPLARIRLRNLESGAGSAQPPAAAERPPAGPQAAPSVRPPPGITQPIPPPSAPAATADALTSPAVIREVQSLLYNLNYNIRAIDGRVGEETRSAIRRWQENVRQPVTGTLTVAQLGLLRSARLPQRWGALAYFARGATSTVWNHTSRESAENAALAQCRRNAGARCDVVTVADQICAALGFYNGVSGGRQHWGAYASVRPTLGAATANALSECRRQARVPNACGVRATVCADGGHTR